MTKGRAVEKDVMVQKLLQTRPVQVEKESPLGTASVMPSFASVAARGPAIIIRLGKETEWKVVGFEGKGQGNEAD